LGRLSRKRVASRRVAARFERLQFSSLFFFPHPPPPTHTHPRAAARRRQPIPEIENDAQTRRRLAESARLGSSVLFVVSVFSPTITELGDPRRRSGVISVNFGDRPGTRDTFVSVVGRCAYKYARTCRRHLSEIYHAENGRRTTKSSIATDQSSFCRIRPRISNAVAMHAAAPSATSRQKAILERRSLARFDVSSIHFQPTSNLAFALDHTRVCCTRV